MKIDKLAEAFVRKRAAAKNSNFKMRILAAAFLNKCVSKAEAENENRQVSRGIRRKISF